MIQETITYTCTNCGSTNIVRNGRNKCGSRQYHCKDCGAYRVLKPKTRRSPRQKATILRACKERCSLRGIQRIFGVARQTVANWIEAHVRSLPDLSQTLLPAQADDVLELDELWSFVGKKQQKRWLWVALCRRTRQIVSFYIGRRDTASCRQLWRGIPAEYRACRCVSDTWSTYQQVIPRHQHTIAGKSSNANAHVERWYNTLRQRLGRYVRRTMSFSKADEQHYRMTRWYIIEYNSEIASLTM